jgi:translation initiation factor eIF-2B subunit epsilon
MDDLIVGIDTENSQIILFEDNLKSSSVSLPVELLAEHPNVDFCTDILDCQIDICSPELMLQFSDNFDYQVNLYNGLTSKYLTWLCNRISDKILFGMKY